MSSLSIPFVYVWCEFLEDTDVTIVPIGHLETRLFEARDYLYTVTGLNMMREAFKPHSPVPIQQFSTLPLRTREILAASVQRGGNLLKSELISNYLSNNEIE
ncbi:hypothetical protein WG66_008620 [Moniliophthora roreri]|nr:hypothetical protein WG66_008620 [Moniliophthora roreri]